MKFDSYFKSQTSRAVSLKQFCEKFDINYSTLPTHTPTRCTTLNSVLERMIDLWEPLKAHFQSLKHPPRILMDFFKSGESLVVVTFLHSVLLLFKKPILLLQETTALFPELAEIVESFKCKILQQQNSNFFGTTTAELLRCVDDERAKILKSSFQEFYTISSEYVDKWFNIEDLPTQTNWTLLREQKVRYEEVVDLAKQLDSQTAMMHELFDKILALNVLLKKIPLDVFQKEKAEKKWIIIFARNNNFPLLYKLIDIVFFKAVGNAFVERVFFLVSAQWTKKRNSLSEKTVKSILQVKINLEVSCAEMHQIISKNKELMEQIVSSAKY